MFDTNTITIDKTVNAGKEKIQEAEAWSLLAGAKEIIVGRGKKFTIYNPATDDREVILKQCLGRTGNLRAPTLKIGDRMIVGFCEDMYTEYVESTL